MLLSVVLSNRALAPSSLQRPNLGTHAPMQAYLGPKTGDKTRSSMARGASCFHLALGSYGEALMSSTPGTWH